MSDEEVDEIIKCTDTQEDLDGNIKFEGKLGIQYAIVHIIWLLIGNTPCHTTDTRWDFESVQATTIFFTSGTWPFYI